MAKTVYVETSVPSAYVSERTDAASVHRRSATRLWWRAQLPNYEACTSELVVAELQQGRWPGKTDAVSLIDRLSRVEADEEVLAVAARFVRERLVPANLAGDAAHLAIACVREIDFLLTWNIRHLANPNKLEHLTVITRRMGLLTPQLVTPETLWSEETL